MPCQIINLRNKVGEFIRKASFQGNMERLDYLIKKKRKIENWGEYQQIMGLIKWVKE